MKRIPSSWDKTFNETLPLSALIPGIAQGIHAWSDKKRRLPHGPNYCWKLLIIIDFLNRVNCKSESDGEKIVSYSGTST
jgi:hypothetical protein